jgi:hypothetical protein
MAESGGADAFANAVVSTFGVIATPNQDQAAAERLGLRFRVYPCVVVRLSCRDCPPIGRYRLAVPADWLGAEALLVDFLEAISSTCRRNQGETPGRRCQVQPTRISYASRARPKLLAATATMMIEPVIISRT